MVRAGMWRRCGLWGRFGQRGTFWSLAAGSSFLRPLEVLGVGGGICGGLREQRVPEGGYAEERDLVLWFWGEMVFPTRRSPRAISVRVSRIPMGQLYVANYRDTLLKLKLRPEFRPPAAAP